ncbi:DUF1294 domain-containing protein [Roseiconus lacunae]|uniref:DUF1294 domain-containing protein n=1 Tax=Roseiconus lacunae TaxID=2605694 RepID=A0ABT7PQY2_9BACT|nr:DUF1294 domain-containing protein [Roseiconus lacunae]MCD0458853.1 DUF1294 domain-containing protein [Roseiconus lacunae]MDM4018875.1 DUF1294 domain-containing protein [Roseiconus lacunae]WRQ49167.1 DUF1294 domain-containing protein [Stieleria sp. HD01]
MTLNLVLGYVVIVAILSSVTFLVYWVDKRRAQSDRWRTSEKTLHLLALFGGWPGAWIAQQKLRHKTQKRRFRIVYYATVVGHLLAVTTIAYCLSNSQ